MQFKLAKKFQAKADRLYRLWLGSDGHSAMTGGEAVISDIEGEKFTAWDGYISGKNLILEPNKRIVQSWRTSEFSEDEDDSQIEILLNEIGEETELTLIHTNLPAHGAQYKQGWEDHYFKPMQAYFFSNHIDN